MVSVGVSCGVVWVQGAASVRRAWSCAGVVAV